ncbi:LTA synthase family protein [Clostridium sp. PL3]|uniref:LTA synthase family protein n=1 Tax=Clostridium thailandense TaxID=2794346 RepID=A0A949X383_9CLOT|nr:LTA synthase family protein [Clostridium thailandense]MBV7274174.1 LTA synthase family protein [Clostridium thailandense]
MEKIVDFLEKNIREIYKDKFLMTAIIGTLLQYVLFILLLSNGKAVSINFKTAILGVPPILVYIAFAIVPYSFAFLFDGREQKLAVIIGNILVSLLMIFDLWYYRSNSSFLNYYMFSMTSNLEGLGPSILAMFRTIDLMFLINTLVLIVIFIKNIRAYKETKRSLSKFGLLFLIPILYLAYNHIKVDKFQRGYAYQYLFKRTWSQNQMMYYLTPIGYHLYDLYNYEQDNKPYVMSNQEQDEIKNYYNSKEKNLKSNEYSGIFKGKNLIVIQVESMENFVINEKVNNQEITPNLNKLINNSLYFSNYHEQTYNGTTADATFVSNTSMLPVLVGNNNFNYPYNDYNSLPKLLKNEGYKTYSMHGEKGNYWNWMTAEKHLGFDNCSDITQFKEDEIIGLGLSDRSFLSQASEKIEEQKNPFYTFMITETSHSPFNLPKNQKTINISDNLKGTKMGGFIECIHYTDAMLGKFIEDLDKKGILENTVIAIYGDHEGVHKFFSEEVGTIKGIPDKWRNNDRRVPLIIYSKGLKGKEIEVNGGQVDFLPTISYLMGIQEDKYINTALGRNLLNTNLDYAVLTNKTYVGTEVSDEEKQKYIEIIQYSNDMIKANYFKGR